MVHSAALRNLDVAQALQISEGKQKTALQHPQVALYVWASVEVTWLYFDIMHPKNHSMVSFQVTSCHQIMRCVCWHTSAICQTASRILCNLQCWMDSIVSVCYCCSICSKYVPLATVLYVALWFLWIDCVCQGKCLAWSCTLYDKLCMMPTINDLTCFCLCNMHVVSGDTGERNLPA